MNKSSWSELSEQDFERRARKIQQPAFRSKSPKQDEEQAKINKRHHDVAHVLELRRINKQYTEVGA